MPKQTTHRRLNLDPAGGPLYVDVVTNGHGNTSVTENSKGRAYGKAGPRTAASVKKTATRGKVVAA